MTHLRGVLLYCGICTVLLLLSLAFKNLGDPQRKGLFITVGLLAASGGIVMLICRQGK